MLLIKDGLSLIINGLFLNSNKNFLFSHVRILKSSYDAEWLQDSKWLATELFLGLTFSFFCKWWYANMFTNS